MRRDRAGFTLIELVVVILVIAIMSGLVMPAYSRYLARARFDAKAGEVADLFAWAQERAVSLDTTCTVTYDPLTQSLTAQPDVSPGDMAAGQPGMLTAGMGQPGQTSGSFGQAGAAQPGVPEGAADMPVALMQQAAQQPPMDHPPLRTVDLSEGYALPDVSVDSSGAGHEPHAGRSIRFQPDGTADFAQITLTASTGYTAQWTLAPATGRLTRNSDDTPGEQP